VIISFEQTDVQQNLSSQRLDYTMTDELYKLEGLEINRTIPDQAKRA